MGRVRQWKEGQETHRYSGRMSCLRMKAFPSCPIRLLCPPLQSRCPADKMPQTRLHLESSAMSSSTLFPRSRILFPTPTAGVPGAQVTTIHHFKELVCGKNKTSALTASKRPSSLLDACCFSVSCLKPGFEEKWRRRLDDTDHGKCLKRAGEKGPP